MATAAHSVIPTPRINHALSLGTQGWGGGGIGTLLRGEGVLSFGVLLINCLAGPVVGLGTRAGGVTMTTVICISAGEGLTHGSVCGKGEEGQHVRSAHHYYRACKCTHTYTNADIEHTLTPYTKHTLTTYPHQEGVWSSPWRHSCTASQYSSSCSRPPH